MSVHVKWETPAEVSEKIYEMIQSNGNGRIKKGSNEVTKAAERGTAKFIVLAEDVNPPELLAHIPLICEEKASHLVTFQVRNFWPKNVECRTEQRPLRLQSWKFQRVLKNNSMRSLN